eukprot:5780134-Pleurochrysis_carterae.AAC.1
MAPLAEMDQELRSLHLTARKRAGQHIEGNIRWSSRWWHETLALGKRIKYWYFRARLWRFVCIHECPGLFHEFNTLLKQFIKARKVHYP